MKVVTFLISVQVWILLLAMLEAKDPYKVACNSTTSATIYIDSKEYTLFPPKNCPHMNQVGSNYTFDCLGDQNHFLVSPVLQNHVFRGGKGSKPFTISCTEQPDSSGRLVTLQATINVDEHFANYTFGAPLTGLNMVISSEDPSNSSQPVTQVTSAVDLGQKLFLVIQSDQTIGDDIFLPMSCSASSKPPLKTTANLWSNASSDCIQDDKLIEKFVIYKNGRKYRNTGPTYNLAYAPIYTFFLTDQEAEDVIYTCNVMVCPRTANSSSNCGKSLKTMSQQRNCLIVDNSVTRRRRRAVDNVDAASFQTRTMSAAIRLQRPNKTQKQLPIVPIIAGAAGAVVLVVLIVAVLLWRRMGKMKRGVENQEAEMKPNK